MTTKSRSIDEKIWLSVAALSFITISSTVIVEGFRNGGFANNSSSENSQPSVSSDSEATSLTSSNTKVVDKNQRFLLGLESSVSSETRTLTKKVPESQKIMAAERVFHAFYQGMTFNDLAIPLMQKYGNNPIYIEYTGALIGTSVGVYCPEYADKLPSRQ